MKVITIRSAFCIPIVYLATLSVASSQMFVNLGFEDSRVQDLPLAESPEAVLVEDGLPGWSAMIGDEVVEIINHNAAPIGGPIISIQGPAFPPIVGNYHILLDSGVSPGSPSTFPPVSVLQAGVIPFDAVTLSFYSRHTIEIPQTLRLELSGENIPLVAFGEDRVAANISAFSGKLVELRLVAQGTNLSNGSHIIDDIQFSSTPIPEPSVVSLIIVFA